MMKRKKFFGKSGPFMPQHWSLRDEIKMETQTDCGGGITVQMCSSEVEVPTVFYAKMN